MADMDNRVAIMNGEIEEIRRENTCTFYAISLFLYMVYLSFMFLAILSYTHPRKVDVGKEPVSHRITGIVLYVIMFSSFVLLGLTCCVAICRNIKRSKKIVPMEAQEPAPMA